MSTDHFHHDEQEPVVALMPFEIHDAIQLTRKDSTISVFIIDRSHSMKTDEQAVRDSMKEALQTLLAPADGREQFASVVSFADGYRVDLPVTHALQIDVDKLVATYEADGNTLLWRTAYKTIKLFVDAYSAMSPEQRQKLKIFFGVFTDGNDNQSDPDKYPKLLIKLAAEARELGIEIFTYGYGIDATRLAKQMGFPTDAEHAKTVTKDRGGIQHSTRSFTQSTTTVGFGRDNRFEGYGKP